MTYFSGWAFNLGGVILTDGSGDGQNVWDEVGCADALVLDVLTDTADGLDLPGLRNEDVTYYQRDGVKHFSDWYNPRVVTLYGTINPNDGCTCDDEGGTEFGYGLFGGGLFGGASDNRSCRCLTIRGQLSALVQAWKRQGDTELVIYPPCDLPTTEADRIFTGPYGVVGRPRGFNYKWAYRDDSPLDFVARFECVDQRVYLLDNCGTPGYTNCVTINPGTELFTVCASDGTGIYAGQKVLCSTGAGVCATVPDTSDDSVDPTAVSVGGTEKVNPTITLFPPLIRPYVENLTTGEYVQLDTTLTADDLPVVINTQDGTAFDTEGNSLTHLLRGSLFLSMYPGNYEWRLLSGGAADTDGTASVCWRDTVVNA